MPGARGTAQSTQYDTGEIMGVIFIIVLVAIFVRYLAHWS